MLTALHLLAMIARAGRLRAMRWWCDKGTSPHLTSPHGCVGMGGGGRLELQQPAQAGLEKNVLDGCDNGHLSVGGLLGGASSDRFDTDGDDEGGLKLILRYRGRLAGVWKIAG